MRNRVAVIIPKFGLLGGAEGFASRLTREVSADPSFEIHVFANKWIDADGSGICFHKIPIVRFPRSLTQPSFAWSVDRKTSGQFDLIHAHDRIYRADIFTMHGIPHRIWVREVRKKRTSLFDLALIQVESRLVRNGGCRIFHAVSGLTRDKFLQEYPGTDPDRVRVIHPGVELSGTELSRADCNGRMRQRFGIGAEDLILLFVSMNFDIKGLDLLMAGLGRLAHRRPNIKWKLLVAGKGEITRYQKLATALGIGERIVFSGAVSRKELTTYYLGSHVFCMPSKFDTFGMAALEAMAASLPVIISENVGARDLIETGRNGFVVRGDDREEQIAADLSLLSDPLIRERVGSEAFRTASVNTWTEVSRKMKSLYEAVLRTKRQTEIKELS